MGLFNLFSSAPAQQATATQPQQQMQPATPGNIPPGTGTNNTPPQPAITESAATPSPMDKFADLWKTDPNAAKSGPEALFSVDPAKLMESVRSVNFAPQISPELAQAIQGGGENAVQAVATLLNQTAQNTYAQAAVASTKIVEQALAKAQQSYDQRIPDMVKQFQVRESLRAENPMFNNPAVSPILSALETAMTSKYPNATSAEIKNMAKDYLEQFATSILPKQPTAQEAATANQLDWGSWLK